MRLFKGQTMFIFLKKEKGTKVKEKLTVPCMSSFLMTLKESFLIFQQIYAFKISNESLMTWKEGRYAVNFLSSRNLA